MEGELIDGGTGREDVSAMQMNGMAELITATKYGQARAPVPWG